MAVNKNFVVKNGLEVNDNLLVADTNSQKVGIGTSVSSYTLHVLGGIGATESYVTGVGTFLSDVYIGGNLNVTGDIVYDEVTGRNIYISGLSTFVGVSTFSTGLFTKDLYVTGVSTFDGAIDANAAINVADSTALTFGADDDLEIYHTAGSNSYIKNNATDLEVRSDSSKFLSKNGSDLFATLNSLSLIHI